MGIRRKIYDIRDRLFRWNNERYPVRGIIINFHRVLPLEQAAKSNIAISIEQFKDVLSWIAGTGQAKSIEHLCEGGIFITFDDGYEDVYEYAYPILKELQIPFTVFMITSTIERKIPEYIWGEKLRNLIDEPLCTIGSHTESHLKLRDRSRRQAWSELCESKAYLEKILEQKISYLAFPQGSSHAFRLRDVRLAKKAGYCNNFLTMSTFLTDWGINHPYMVPRYSIYKDNMHKAKEDILRVVEVLDDKQSE